MLYGRVSLGGIVIGEVVIFEEPYPVTGPIVENVGRNLVREVVNWMRLRADCEVYDLCFGRLNDITDDLALFYRDNPDSLVAGWIEDERSKV